MALKECSPIDTMSGVDGAAQALDTLVGLRRAAQQLYTSQFQGSSDGGASWSPQQMRVGIALLNLIRTTILDEARLSKEPVREKTENRKKERDLESFGKPANTEPAPERGSELRAQEPVNGAANQEAEPGDTGTTEGKFERDRLLRSGESLASVESSSEEFPHVPHLVVREVRRRFVNGDFIPDPGAHDAPRARGTSPGDG